MPLEKKEKTLELKLSYIAEPKPVLTQKVIEPKVESKPKNKPKPKLKKVIKKKINTIKKVPIIKEKIEPKEEQIVKQKLEEPKIIEKIIQPIVENNVSIIEREIDKKPSIQAEYMDKNIKEIIELLKDNLYYPRSARKRGITGEVIVKFKLCVDAHTSSIEIISSSSKILSRASIKTIENLSGKFPKPKEELLLQIPINYNLKR
ncbi:MAG: TonB family protein [Campylobacterota bacterium]|nr:TonB family protein [Campylobacterota bacterium]